MAEGSTIVMVCEASGRPSPSETEVAEGSTIVMVCEASGRPEPVITWQLKNTDIDR